MEQLRKHHAHAVAGDAADPAVLIQAHIARAGAMIITAADVLRIQQMVETAKILNPQAEILISTHDPEAAARLEKENMGLVFLDEQVLAQNITQHLLKSLHEFTPH